MDYRYLNDFELVYMVREKDDDAMGIMIDKYMPIIRKMACHFFVSYNKCVDKEDLVQEGVIALYRSIKTYDNNTASFYTYVLISIKNAMLRVVLTQTNDKNKANIYSKSIEEIEDYIGYSLDYFVMEEDKYFFDNMLVFKNSLKDVDSCIFELRCNDFSYKEIAELLDVSKKYVDNRLYIIKKKLKKYLKITSN